MSVQGMLTFGDDCAWEYIFLFILYHIVFSCFLHDFSFSFSSVEYKWIFFCIWLIRCNWNPAGSVFLSFGKRLQSKSRRSKHRFPVDLIKVGIDFLLFFCFPTSLVGDWHLWKLFFGGAGVKLNSWTLIIWLSNTWTNC